MGLDFSSRRRSLSPMSFLASSVSLRPSRPRDRPTRNGGSPPKPGSGSFLSLRVSGSGGSPVIVVSSVIHRRVRPNLPSNAIRSLTSCTGASRQKPVPSRNAPSYPLLQAAGYATPQSDSIQQRYCRDRPPRWPHNTPASSIVKERVTVFPVIRASTQFLRACLPAGKPECQ